MCVLIAVNNWVIGLTGNWYSISVIFLTIGIFNLEQVSVFRPILFSNMTTTIIKNINKNNFTILYYFQQRNITK